MKLEDKNERPEKPTYEQLEFRVADRERQIERLKEELRGVHQKAKEQRLILRGMVDEHFHIRVNIDPLVLTQDAFEAIQALLRNYVGQTVAAIEEKMGEPLTELQRALQHIHYLENHASHCGLHFTQFGLRDRHFGLINAY